MQRMGHSRMEEATREGEKAFWREGPQGGSHSVQQQVGTFPNFIPVSGGRDLGVLCFLSINAPAHLHPPCLVPDMDAHISPKPWASAWPALGLRPQIPRLSEILFR